MPLARQKQRKCLMFMLFLKRNHFSFARVIFHVSVRSNIFISRASKCSTKRSLFKPFVAQPQKRNIFTQRSFKNAKSKKAANDKDASKKLSLLSLKGKKSLDYKTSRTEVNPVKKSCKKKIFGTTVLQQHVDRRA